MRKLSLKLWACFLVGLLSLFFILPNSMADIGSDLSKVFQSMGSHTNASEGGAYQDQSAGYYSGGSLFIRNQNRNLQPATIQLPGVNAGCGGIDMHMGGFSFVDSQQLVEMMRNIGSKATSYAFMLAVQSLTPQVYNVINELNALAQEINQFNINSCEVASTMVGSVWPKSDIASKHLCQSMGTSRKTLPFSDWASSRHKCGVGGEREATLSEAAKDERYKDIFVDEYNLAWKVIQKDPLLQGDTELSELFMTLSGTVIFRKKGDRHEFEAWISLADQKDLLNALLNGGEASVYVCDEKVRCLRPKSLKKKIPHSHAFKVKVKKILKSMINKIHEDKELTGAEKGLLNATKLPIYKILNVHTAYQKGKVPLSIHEYDELIALDIMNQYIIEILNVVSYGLTQIRNVQIDDTQVNNLQKQLSEVRRRVIEGRHSAFEKLNTALSLIQKTQLIEREVYHMMGILVSEEIW